MASGCFLGSDEGIIMNHDDCGLEYRRNAGTIPDNRCGKKHPDMIQHICHKVKGHKGKHVCWGQPFGAYSWKNEGGE